MRSKGKKYQVIYADPPWAYRKKHGNGTAARHYPLMDVESIKALPVAAIADENCMLFLWATFPTLPNALEVIKAWGFTYKTLGFSWIKTNTRNGKPFFGIGYYTRSNCEVCLIAVRGKRIIKSNSVSSVVISPRQRHSQKPAIIRDRIVELCGDVPRIELFARNKTDGWDVWGNEVASDISLPNAA